MSWRKIKEDDPKRLAKLGEAALALDTERRELAKRVEALEEEVDEIKELIIRDFDKAALKEVKTALGTLRLVKKTVPQMDPITGGWDAIYKYIFKHKAWDLLQKRLGEKACQARWDDGKKIPGVKQFDKIDIKLGDAE